MIVLDAAGAVELLLATATGAAVARRLRGETVHIPAHFDVEVIGAIRRAVIRRLISDHEGLVEVDLATGEIVDNEGNYVYRLSGDSISASGFSTACVKGTKATVTVVISNLPTGDIQVLDADYLFRLTGSSKP